MKLQLVTMVFPSLPRVVIMEFLTSERIIDLVPMIHHHFQICRPLAVQILLGVSNEPDEAVEEDRGGTDEHDEGEDPTIVDSVPIVKHHFQLLLDVGNELDEAADEDEDGQEDPDEGDEPEAEPEADHVDDHGLAGFPARLVDLHEDRSLHVVVDVGCMNLVGFKTV